MKNTTSFILFACFATAILTTTSFAQRSYLAVRDTSEAQLGVNSPTKAVAVSDHHRRAFVHVGMTGALYHPSATVAAGGATVPGASAGVDNQYTVTAEVGYFLTRHITVSLLAGVPIKPTLYGTGTAAAFGNLGRVLYGPAVASAQYHFRAVRHFSPYVGGGAAYAIIFKNYDGAIQNLKVPNHFGYALQGGAEYRINRKISLFADFKQIFLDVNASGEIFGVIPATSKVTLNPSLPTAGISYSF